MNGSSARTSRIHGTPSDPPTASDSQAARVRKWRPSCPNAGEVPRVSHETRRFYLGIGNVFSESVTSRLKTYDRSYVSKLLRSTPANWWTIAELLAKDDLAGALVKLTGNDYVTLLRPQYYEVREALLARLGDTPHLVLVHEAVAGLPPDTTDEDEDVDWDGITWNDRVAREHFGDMDSEVQVQVQDLLDLNNIEVTTYKTNAEAAVIAASFVDDLQDDLIFRLYVPAGRLFEDELSRILAMFHHWLGTVKGAQVRQGGYKTASGRVIEFFGDGFGSQDAVRQEFAEFERFLQLINDPSAASAMLVGLGVDHQYAHELAARYARDARRVLLDARHERDRRMLSIRQQLEAELSEQDLPLASDELARLVEALVPVSPLKISLGEGSVRPDSSREPSITINTQVVHRAEGIVAQHISGHVVYGTPLDELLTFVRSQATDDNLELEAAAKQVADPGAPTATRLKARQQLKTFLLRNATRLEAAAFSSIWHWLESQVGA